MTLTRRTLLLGSATLALPACERPPPPSPPAPTPSPQPTPSAAPEAKTPVERAIANGARYLVGVQAPTGRFRYRVQLDPLQTPKPGYNLLRHAGSLYALAQYQSRWPDPRVATALKRGADFLRGRVEPVEASPDALAVWSGGGKAKLGGAGLALVAFQSMAAVGLEEAAPLELQRGLARFTALLQGEDGAFVSRYRRGEGPDDSWTSLYYPGEAALGLLMLHDRDSGGGWDRIAVGALHHLADVRRGETAVPEDHWALIATARWLAGPGREARGELREDLVHHAEQVVDRMLGARVPHRPTSPLHGCFGPHGRTTPTATRLEGLLAIAPHLDEERAAMIREHGGAGIEFLRRSQVREGPFVGAVPRAHQRLEGLPADADFNRQATEVRIDYVQHAMSAWMGWLDRGW